MAEDPVPSELCMAKPAEQRERVIARTDVLCSLGQMSASTCVVLCSLWKEHHGNLPGEIAVTATPPDCFSHPQLKRKPCSSCDVFVK